MCYATLGSLFDGIGGFPLAAVKVGIKPIWASEIEAAPISITKKHFPDMRHLGDITKINGAEIEPVDIITFGSPCQDLSITGNRAGLEGKRSGLFNEALRVIREMRNATGNKYPTRIIWENVPGAFSSQRGKDFKTVIEEIGKISEKDFSIPRLPKRNKWLASGAVMGDCFSLAWRVFDSQYWGVPQQRRRIFLVGNFGSRCAAEILFKSEGKTGNFNEGATVGDRVAKNVKRNFEQRVVNISYSSDRIYLDPEKSITIKSQGGGGGAKTGLYCLPFICSGYGRYKQGDISKTLLSSDDITTGDLIADEYTVRRLTPLECERLQGFPDGWTEYGYDGKKISDSQRYKALGNSVAIPCVVFILSSMIDKK